MSEEVKKLTIKEADEFIKKKVIGVLIKADVTIVVNELEAIYGDSLANGTVGDSFYIYNCPENYDESDYEELEYIDYSDMCEDDIREERAEAGDFNLKVYKWFIVDPRFTELLKDLGEIVAPDINLWGCCEDIEDASEATVIEEFFERMQILYGQKNAIITEKLSA